MTPEERWTKIEQQTAENQKQIARISEQMERKTSQIDAQIEKNTVAIRDLIVVSRTFLDSQKETTKQIEEMRAAQQEAGREWRGAHLETTEKLNALIEIVDQIIRKRDDKS